MIHPSKNFVSPLILALSFLVISCNFQSASVAGKDENIVPDNTSLGQNLPLGAKFTVNEEIIELEVAQTPQQQAIGLMYRDSLPRNRGMLFIFTPPQNVSFWMKNVSISLDMVFLSNGVIQYIVTAPPCSAEPCPLYSTNVPVDQVIELAQGRANELNLQVGDRLSIEMIDK